MDGSAYLESAERDGKIVTALHRALEAMMLTHGGRITMVGVSGTLNFEREMLGLREALALLAVDPDESPSSSPPPARAKRKN